MPPFSLPSPLAFSLPPLFKHMTGSFYLYLPALLTLVLHLPTLSNNLVWDDRAAVPMNPDATGQRPLMSLFTHDFWGQDITLDDSHKSYRPLATLTYRLNHNLHGLNPLGYHLVNVLTHTLVTYLFSRFSAQVTQPAAALIAALLFAVHPIHAEPVSCIVGRSDLLCALFVLVGLLSHLSSMDLSSIDLSSKAANPATNPSIRPATKYSAFIIAILSGFIATFCKELGVTVYGLYFAHEIIVAITQSPLPLLPALASHFTSPSTLPRLLLTLLSPFLITSLHLYLHKSASLYTWSILENSISLLPSRTARALSYAHTHTLYMLKLFLPTSLCYDYGYPCIPHITSPLDYRNVFSLTMYAAVVYFGVHAAVNKNAPRLWAGALLVVPFIPASNLFFPVGTVLGERLLYMPSMGFCLGVGVVLNETFPSALRAFSLCAPPTPPTPTPTPTPSPSKKKSPKKKCSRKFPVSPFALSILSLLLLLSLKSVHRCQEWRSEITLFESALKVCPTSLKVLNNLALMLLDKKTAPRAGELLDTAIAIHADYPSALFNRGLVSYVLSDWGDAIQFFELSLKSDSYQPKAWAYLSQTKLTVAFELQKEGRWEEAKVMLGEALIQSDNAIAQGCTLPLAFHVRCQVGHELELGEESLWYCR